MLINENFIPLFPFRGMHINLGKDENPTKLTNLVEHN